MRPSLGVAAAAVVASLALPVPGPVSPAAATSSSVRVLMVATGAAHTLVLDSDRRVWSAGGNVNGELGTTTQHAGFEPVPLPGDAMGVAAGTTHSLVVLEDGRVVAFGSNAFGQLGVPTSTARVETPTVVPGLSGITSVAAGYGYSLARDFDGRLWTFGLNDRGQLGRAGALGLPTGDATPTEVPGLAVGRMTAGRAHVLATATNGTTWSWGSNEHGQLGRPDGSGTTAPNPTPGQLGFIEPYDISAGGDHSLVVDGNNDVWSFGSNRYGQLGRADGLGTATPQPAPAPVPGLPRVATATAGASHSILATYPEYRAWSFGRNADRELVRSTGGAPFTATPAPVPGLADVLAYGVGVGLCSCTVIASDQGVWAAGERGVSFVPPADDPEAPTLLVTPWGPPTGLAGAIRPVDPIRLLDTRLDGSAPPAPGSSVRLPVRGQVGVPLTATAVLVNLTLVGATGPGFVQAYGTGDGTPGASSTLNADRAGQTIANAAIVPIGTDGSITLFDHAGGHLVVDVVGYVVPVAGPTAAGRLGGLPPSRALDTRLAGGRVAGGAVVRVQPNIPLGGVRALVLNVTATETGGPGYVQVGPAGRLVPGSTSTLNIDRAGDTVANAAIVPIGAAGSVEVYTHATAHLIVDVVGYVTDGEATRSSTGRFRSVSPTRALDTRRDGPRPGPGALVRVATAGVPGLPLTGVMAIAANVTVTDAAAPGYVQTAAAGLLDPGRTSTVNVDRAGQTVANAAVIPTSDGGIDLMTQSGAHLVLDVTGWFTT